jgi:hypothetical protein
MPPTSPSQAATAVCAAVPIAPPAHPLVVQSFSSSSFELVPDDTSLRGGALEDLNSQVGFWIAGLMGWPGRAVTSVWSSNNITGPRSRFGGSVFPGFNGNSMCVVL